MLCVCNADKKLFKNNNVMLRICIISKVVEPCLRLEWKQLISGDSGKCW